jgi:hypothetical protein
MLEDSKIRLEADQTGGPLRIINVAEKEGKKNEQRSMCRVKKQCGCW